MWPSALDMAWYGHVVLFVKEFLDVFWDTVCVTFNGISIIAKEVLVYVQKYHKKT